MTIANKIATQCRRIKEIGEAALRTGPALSIGTVTFPQQHSYTLFAVPFTEA